MDVDIFNFIKEQALVLVPVLYILGAFLKKTPVIRDWWIPWILLAVGILCTLGLLGFGVESALQGVLVSGAAVLGNQLIKQTLNKDC